MTTIFIRTLLTYTFLTLIMRLMGKRHIGELEISELVGTFLISEIASIPIENQEIPLIFAIVPILTIATIEIISSIVLIKFPKLKNIISTRPSPLIEKGVLNQKELTRSRISIEELISELRQQSIGDINEVNYAVLEPNGKVSIVLKAPNKTVSASDVNLPAQENGITHILISNGSINKYNMKKHKKDEAWLTSKLKEFDCSLDDIFLFLIDDLGNIQITKRSNK